MSLLEAVILGVVQGLTEFLPVSSTGHLIIIQKIFNINEPALFFGTMLHVGTLAAVFFVLRKDIWSILKKINQPLTLYLIIGTIPAIIFALVFRKQLEYLFNTGEYLFLAFFITAALLITAELLAKRSRRSLKNASSMSWLEALIVGIFQAVAVIPGISRSGATLAGALSCKLNRDFAARFSFLLSIPAILGAVFFQLIQSNPEAKAVDTALAVTGIGIPEIIAGTLSAALTGFFAIRFMLWIVRTKPLWGFAIYTGLLGLFLLIDKFALHFF